MHLIYILLCPALAAASVLPTLTISGLGGLMPTTTVQGNTAITPTGLPISKPTGVLLSSVSYAGSGCPSGSVSTSLSTDKTVVTLGFDEFQAYTGPGTAVKDHSKACNILLALSYPKGYSFTVISATYHGYAQLDPGVTGSFYSNYFFSSFLSNTFSTSASVIGGGPAAAGTIYTRSSSISTSKLVSTCALAAPGGLGSSAVLNVGNTISLSSINSSASGQMTDDDATVATTQQVTLQWYSC